MTTYIFPLDIEEEEDGRWSADIPALRPVAPSAATRVSTS